MMALLNNSLRVAHTRSYEASVAKREGMFKKACPEFCRRVRPALS